MSGALQPQPRTKLGHKVLLDSICDMNYNGKPTFTGGYFANISTYSTSSCLFSFRGMYFHYTSDDENIQKENV